MKQSQKGPSIQLKHGLGQNFILDESIQSQLVELAEIGPDDNVLEIGAGSGALTAQLAKRCRRVMAIEIDREMIPWLKAATLNADNVDIIQGDATRLNLPLLTKELGPFKIVANLPYHITTELITMLVSSSLPILSMHIMLQKESAEKLCASPGESGYGPLTLRTQWRSEPHIALRLPAEAFTPPPKVDSAFLALIRRETPPAAVTDEKQLFRLISASFALKRKTLVNNLMNAYHRPREETVNLLRSLPIKETVRAEELSIQDFVRLFNACLEMGWIS